MPSARGHVVSMSDYYGDEGPGTGGAGLTALRIADILRAAGVDLEIIAGFAFPERRRNDPGVTFLAGSDLRSASKSSLAALAKGLWNEGARREVRRRIGGRDPANTLVMLHQWTRFYSPAALSEIAHFSHIVYVHDYFWACPTGSYYNYRKNLPCDLLPTGPACLTTSCDRAGPLQKGYRVARHFLKEAAIGSAAVRRLFIHISDRSRRFYEPLFPKSTHVTMYHPIGAVPAAEASDLEYDVAYFGRLEPEKGVLELAAAAQRAGKSCLLVGAGSEAAAIRERYPAVTVTEWATRAEVFALMRKCRAVVLPSLWIETWGSIVPEAMSQSVPVLVSKHAGSAELVGNFGGGIIFDPSLPAAFDAAILRITSEREAHARDARRAFDAAGLDEAAYVSKYVAAIKTTFGMDLLA